MKSVIPHPKLQALEGLEQESEMIHGVLKTSAEEALTDVCFDDFYAKLEQRIQAESVPAKPVVQTPETPSIFQQWLQWFQANPTLTLGSACAFVIAGMFVLPLVNSGPEDKGDVIVEKVLKKKSTRVAVVQTNDQSGKPMTVVVINESGTYTDQTDKDSKTTPSPAKVQKTPAQPK